MAASAYNSSQNHGHHTSVRASLCGALAPISHLASSKAKRMNGTDDGGCAGRGRGNNKNNTQRMLLRRMTC